MNRLWCVKLVLFSFKVKDLYTATRFRKESRWSSWFVFNKLSSWEHWSSALHLCWAAIKRNTQRKGGYCSSAYHSIIFHVQESAAVLIHPLMFSPCMCAVMTFPVRVCLYQFICVCVCCCLLCVSGLSCSSHASNDILLSHSCHSRFGFHLVCTSGSTHCSHWPGPSIPHQHTHSLRRPFADAYRKPHTHCLSFSHSRSPFCFYCLELDFKGTACSHSRRSSLFNKACQVQFLAGRG